jgi:hypothetical protein
MKFFGHEKMKKTESALEKAHKCQTFSTITRQTSVTNATQLWSPNTSCDDEKHPCLAQKKNVSVTCSFFLLVCLSVYCECICQTVEEMAGNDYGIIIINSFHRISGFVNLIKSFFSAF